nr:GIY-YIG nuclease family protein [Sphingomonas sp. PAMC 26621]
MDEQACIDMMASRRNGTLYLGSTNDLVRRVWEHCESVVGGFTKTNGCKLLVWYEAQSSFESARVREFQMKSWHRTWKVREIEGLNREWERRTIGSHSHDGHRYWAPAFAGEGI